MQYLSTKTAGEQLGVNASRVRQLILAGRLRAEKVGPDWLIRPQAVAALQDPETGRPRRKRNKRRRTSHAAK